MKVAPENRKKKQHSKSREGCITCKKRHLKCDEVKPECQRCTQDFGRCEGFQILKPWLCEVSQHPKFISDSSDSISNDSEWSSSTADLPILVDDTSQPRQRRWAPKSRTGCTSCRRRRVKCDETRPACSRCAKSRLDCDYPDVKAMDEKDVNQHVTRIAKDGEQSSYMPETKSVNPLLTSVKMAPYKSHSEHQALQYWLTRTDNCDVVTGEYGSFNILGIELPQAAWTCQSARHGLFAAAAVTNSLEKFAEGELDVGDADERARKHSSLAIRHLFAEKPSPHVTALVAFAFWFMEAWYGSWDQAVLHLAGATRVSREGHARGEVTKAVAWYIQVISDSVPLALKEIQPLSLSEPAQRKTHTTLSRLRYGIKEVEQGSMWTDQVRSEAERVRPFDCGVLLLPLRVHQKQMAWLCEKWRKYESTGRMKSDNLALRLPTTSTYTKVKEQTELFLSQSPQFDLLTLELRLKMLLRSLSLFVAGPNVEMRRDAAMVITYGSEVHASMSKEYSNVISTGQTGSFVPINAVTGGGSQYILQHQTQRASVNTATQTKTRIELIDLTS